MLVGRASVHVAQLSARSMEKFWPQHTSLEFVVAASHTGDIEQHEHADVDRAPRMHVIAGPQHTDR